MLGARRLHDGEVKLVIGKAFKGLIDVDELDKKRVGTVLATWPAIEVSQQRGLMGTAQQDFGITAIELTGNWRQTNEGAQIGLGAHRVISQPQCSAGQR